MKKNKCVSCGTIIEKLATDDPYTCRSCELDHGTELGRYDWLDKA